MAEPDNKLHWTQRIALIRHNLHAASRSGDFTFFRTLQAAGFMEGTNHVAALTDALEDESDTIMAAMDNLNAGLAYAHQDAFKAVYDSVKANLGQDSDNKKHESTVHQDAFKDLYDSIKETAGKDDGDEDKKNNDNAHKSAFEKLYETIKAEMESDMERKKEEARSRLFVDSTTQRNLADLAIDKMTSSTINLINQLPTEAQEAATKVWVTGMTIIADAIDVSLKQLDALEFKLDDFIRLEESWHTVKASVVFAITGLKGVFELMDPNLPSFNKSSPRNSSIASAGASVFRRLSNAFTPSAAGSRNPSVASVGAGPPVSFQPHHAAPTFGAPVYRTPNFRSAAAKGNASSFTLNSTAGFPSVGGSNWTQHKLAPIPPTPAFDDSTDPFDKTNAPRLPALPAIPSSPDATAPEEANGNPFELDSRAETVVM